jgi:NAD-dependent dihydropyrimidine dehydrogenase PreA subunit
VSSTDVRCRADGGLFGPQINRNRCEGKGECERVCPYGVFKVGTLAAPDRRGLSLVGRLKGIGHRWQQALLVNADACRACGLCVAACPEKAITLVRR